MDKHTDPSTEPFFFPGGEPGVLLIHGFLTSPDEMRTLGEYLAGAGMTVHGVRLRGHGTRPHNLAGVRWQDWLTDARKGLGKLRQHCQRTSIAGLSLGGVLALHLAALYPVERVVTYGTPDPTMARHPAIRLAEAAAHIIRYVPKIGSDVRDPQARRAHFTYTRIPLRSVVEIGGLLEALAPRLPRIKAPTLLVQARHDQVIPAQTPYRLAARISGPTRVSIIERGGHTVIVDYDRDIVFQQTLAWLRGDNT